MHEERKFIMGIGGIIIREYKEEELTELIRIWNEVVEDGVAFPQEELLDEKTSLPDRHIRKQLEVDFMNKNVKSSAFFGTGLLIN